MIIYLTNGIITIIRTLGRHAASYNAVDSNWSGETQHKKLKIFRITNLWFGTYFKLLNVRFSFN